MAPILASTVCCSFAVLQRQAVDLSIDHSGDFEHQLRPQRQRFGNFCCALHFRRREIGTALEEIDVLEFAGFYAKQIAK